MKTGKQFWKGFTSGMALFGHTISTLVNSILLTFVYVVGVGLSSLFVRISGKRLVQKRISKKAKSYWSNLSTKKRPLEEYYRQF
ncbi:hypothetical protein CMO92_02790 [Candidatus Woesearchaeota archaeon]|nr:hypothetical protein [Candidatus Woesearchaeota archaeon]|tara:strand:+ start:701 stop:952 length:252 start_codon:yes stop_codon:yes gene_type:complete